MTQSSSQKKSGLLSVFLVVAALYFAREVFMPLALAILLAFLLEPLAKRFEKLHLGRACSGVLSVLLAMVIAGTLTFLLLRQLGEFGNKLPEYKKNIQQRIQTMEQGDGGVIGRTFKSMQDIHVQFNPTNVTSITNAVQGKPDEKPEPKPMPVEVRNQNSPLQMVRKMVGPTLNILVDLFLVIVFAIFILIGRDDLRARLIKIAGSDNTKVTKNLFDETRERLSRYLLMQFFVNVSYGIVIGLALWLAGIPEPLLWGITAGLLRYVPYAGPWIAASLPFAIGLAVGTDWVKPFAVLGIFGVVEIITANAIEPWLYGNSTGITSLAVLLAAVFWTWLWGPVGLLLSMPLTVCLVSIGRYFPQLELLDQLFGEEKSKDR